jgi:hypothetical protein
MAPGLSMKRNISVVAALVQAESVNKRQSCARRFDILIVI